MANTYLTRTPSSTGNDKIATFSAWIKRGSSLGSQNNLFTSFPENDRTQLFFTGSDTLQLQSYSSGSATMNVKTNRVFRDVNSWYHIVIAMDSTQATASNRVKFYVNGVQETSFAVATYINQNTTLSFNTASRPFYLGTYNTSQLFFDGVMSHVHWIDGTAYDASAFGETDATTGEWKINTAPSVTYGTNGFFILKDGNSVTDQSPNTNNWSVAGGTLTKTEDCPNNVFATCSKEPVRNVSGTRVSPVLSNGNNTWDATGISAGASVTLSTLGAKTGKYYMEAKVGGSYAGHSRIGVGTHEGYNGTTFFNSTSSNYVSYTANGEKNIAGTTSTYGATWGTGQIISVALDCDNNQVTFYKDGVSQGAISITNNDNFKHFSFGGYDATGSNITNWQCNFGNGYFGTTAVSSNSGNGYSGTGSLGIFQYQPPTGFTALCTKGLNL